MRTLCAIAMLATAMLLTACSDDAEVGKPAESHAWEDQVNSIDDARTVEETLDEAANQQLEAIETVTE